MPARSKEEKLFGAACLKLTLDKTNPKLSSRSPIYLGALEDLGLSEKEVELFLQEKRSEVESALKAQHPSFR